MSPTSFPLARGNERWGHLLRTAIVSPANVLLSPTSTPSNRRLMIFLEISLLRPAMYQQSRTSGGVWSANPPDSKKNGGSISINSDIGCSIEFVNQASSSNRAPLMRDTQMQSVLCDVRSSSDRYVSRC